MNSVQAVIIMPTLEFYLLFNEQITDIHLFNYYIMIVCPNLQKPNSLFRNIFKK